MVTVRTFLALPLAFLVFASSAASAAGQHIVAPNELATTVADRVAKQDADRAAIAEALARPDVREVAATMGVDLSRIATAAATLDGADLERVAAAARDVDEHLVGGASTVVISTTTIIIILLLIIILILAIK